MHIEKKNCFTILVINCRYNGKQGYGEFLQMSGIRVIYDLKAPQGSRVVGISVLCTDCDVPAYEQLNEEKEYNIVLNAFLSEGGDDYGMLKNESISRRSIGIGDLEAAQNYLLSESPIRQGLEERITFVNFGEPSSSVTIRFTVEILLLPLILLFAHRNLFIL